MKTYIVGIGGTPENTWEEFDDKTDAILHALDMAIERAVEMGSPPETTNIIDTWENKDKSGAVIGGACPEGDEGGCWPIVKVKQ